MTRREHVERAAHLSASGVPFVVATAVHTRRPTSVRPGDTAIVLADGTIEGFVGGSCAESSVRLHALRAMETGEPLLLRIVPDDAGAGGAEPDEGAVVEHNPCLSGGALEIFLEPQLPAPRLTVVGTAPVAQALGRIAAAAGYDVVAEVTEFAPRDVAMVVASHGTGEEDALSAALTASVPYVALVASRVRGAAVRDSLDVPDELRALLHTPAGLDIGARSAEEIAISILAEIVALRHAHPGAPVAEQRTSRDPVCGMEVVITASTPQLEGESGRVYFCCDGCRDAYARQHAPTP